MPEPSKLDTVTSLPRPGSQINGFQGRECEHFYRRPATSEDAAQELPRKEVIQPHLPVRLPCYDFTPLTLYTFGASLPCGLGQRLRVRTTRVV